MEEHERWWRQTWPYHRGELPFFRAHAIVLRGWALVEQGSGKRASLSCAKGSPRIARPERSLSRAEARDLRAPVYGWFTEGFETADLKEAKALLDKLTEPAIAAEE